MKIKKEDLDKRVCDIYEEEVGTNTLREWIIECEDEYEIRNKDLNNMTDEEINEYVEWLEYLGEK